MSDTVTPNPLDAIMTRVHDMARRTNGGYNDERETDAPSVVSRHYDYVTAAPASGTLKAWMQAHHGQEVHTVQVGRNGSMPWAPTGRTVDASRASFVTLGGSRRDYAGMRTLHATTDAIIVADDWQIVFYVAAAPTH